MVLSVDPGVVLVSAPSLGCDLGCASTGAAGGQPLPLACGAKLVHTMEWGFLADLLRRPEALALVDELFIELHFYSPSLNWVHLTHSMKQAFDVLRQLRACGLPVHAWP